MTLMSDFALDILLRQKDGGGWVEDRGIRKVQMGKKNNKTVTTCCVLHVHVVHFHGGCQVLHTVCILLFPPVQVASHGEPH